ncbi:uncharacterized protein LOC126371000 [Pectinophora gossypiella]|uniref:uncharacterized protein LOC126371000 n=1 Tax=Pectinophora gossypiella TaxID=13191 RepID=UPI00214F0009|nr:uncharacterized protein LOC126371000 [Pectinophora gossypiella]
MKRNGGVLIAIVFKIIYAESRMLPMSFVPDSAKIPMQMPQERHITQEPRTEAVPHEKVVGLKGEKLPDADSDEMFSYSTNFLDPKDRCAILVMSNQGQTSMQQSLLRKYRYNQNGDLIPSSVQYFIKFPQGGGTAVLVPLKDKAFSPSGGFVRYYKEVPPIPQSWKR